jgi:hypothetical protein
MASIVASRVVIGCIAGALILCFMCLLDNIEGLINIAEEEEEGE